MDDDTRERERAWIRTIFLGGWQAGGQDVREHPQTQHDPLEGGNGSRAELAFQKWLQGMVPECQR